VKSPPTAAQELLVEATISVPHKYHYAIIQNGNLFRTIKSFGAAVEQTGAPQKFVPKRPPPPATALARIDDDLDATQVPSDDWQVITNYQDADEGAASWALKGRDQESLQKAQKAIEDALKQAEQATHVGFMTLADRTVFPRVVGAKGANVARLRAETGAEITVGRDDNTIVLVGK
jgi:hypothetical protein